MGVGATDLSMIGFSMMGIGWLLGCTELLTGTLDVSEDADALQMVYAILAF